MVKRIYKIDDTTSIQAEDYSYDDNAWKLNTHGGIVVFLQVIQDENPFQTKFKIYKNGDPIPEGQWKHVVIIRAHNTSF